MNTVISAIVDGVLKALIGWLTALQEKRKLVQQGRQEQHTADLEATNQKAKDAQVINEHVTASSDDQLDAELERMRSDAASGHR